MPAVTALLDRLLHHAHVLKCGPRSWRTKVAARFSRARCFRFWNGAAAAASCMIWQRTGPGNSGNNTIKIIVRVPSRFNIMLRLNVPSESASGGA